MPSYRVRTTIMAGESYTISAKPMTAERCVHLLLPCAMVTNVHLQTALQVYCRAYKQAPVNQAHGLLRKARRLDSLLNRSSEPPPIPPSSNAQPEFKCCKCSSKYSPAFYPTVPKDAVHLSSDGNYYLCHRCKFLEEHEDDKSSASSASSLSSKLVNGIAKKNIAVS